MHGYKQAGRIIVTNMIIRGEDPLKDNHAWENKFIWGEAAGPR